MFVLLELESDREAIGSDGLGEFAAGNGCVIGGHGLEHVALLTGFQRVDPRKEHLAFTEELAELRLCPVVIFARADYAFHFVGGAEVLQVCGQVAFALAAAGAFEIDDAISSGEELSKSLAFAKFEAVIPGSKEPISFTTSPIK